MSIQNAAARPTSIGVAPRRAATVQLTAGQKKPTGQIDPSTVNRFYLVNTYADGGAKGAKAPGC